MSVEVVVAVYVGLVMVHTLLLGLTGRGINGHIMVAVALSSGIDDNVGALLLAMFSASELIGFIRRIGKEK